MFVFALDQLSEMHATYVFVFRRWDLLHTLEYVSSKDNINRSTSFLLHQISE